VEKFESDIDPNHIIDQFLMRQKLLTTAPIEFNGPASLTNELIRKIKMAIRVICLHYKYDTS
jgi:hypothetical protein